MSEFDPLTGVTVGNNISSPAAQVRQPFVPGAIQAVGQLTERAWSTNRSVVVDRHNGLWRQLPETPFPPTPEDVSGADSVDLSGNRQVGLPHKFQGKNSWRTAVFTLLLLLIASCRVHPPPLANCEWYSWDCVDLQTERCIGGTQRNVL